MLSIGKMGRAHLAYYLDLAREDNALQREKTSGYWLGKGCERLGVSGSVEPEALYNFLDGYSKNGRERLVQVQPRSDRTSHRSAWDCTLSAPKSVSVLWSQSPPEIRERIEECQRKAVAAALDYLEGEACFTRRGAGGSRLERSDLTAAAFEHFSSRAGDPALHTHVLLLNIGVRDDGTTGTLHSPSLYGAKMTAGALYQVELATELQLQGLSVERDRFSFRLKEVPKGLERSLSKRRNAIEKVLEGMPDAGPQKAATVTLRTRSAKENVPYPALFARWKQEASRFHWGEAEARLSFNPQGKPAERNETKLRAAFDEGLQQVSESGKSFSKQDFLRASAPKTIGLGFTAREVRTASQNYLIRSPIIEQEGWRQGERKYLASPLLEKSAKSPSATVMPSSVPERERTVKSQGSSASEQRAEKMQSLKSVSFQVGGKVYNGVQYVYRTTKKTAEVASKTYNELLETFVRFTRSQEVSGYDSVMVVGTREEAAELNRIAQDQRRRDRELDEMFIQAENACFYVMDRVRVTTKNFLTGKNTGRYATISQIDPEGVFINIRFSDGGQMKIPTMMLPVVRLGYAIPAEELKEAFAPRRLFIWLNETVYKDLKLIEPQHPNNGFQFVIAEAGRRLSTRLSHELSQSDHQLREAERRSIQPSLEHSIER